MAVPATSSLDLERLQGSAQRLRGCGAALVLPCYTTAGGCARALLPGLVLPLPPPGSGVETPLGQASALTTPGLRCFLVRARRRSGHSSTAGGVWHQLPFGHTPPPRQSIDIHKSPTSRSPLVRVPTGRTRALVGFVSVIRMDHRPVPLRSGWSSRWCVCRACETGGTCAPLCPPSLSDIQQTTDPLPQLKGGVLRCCRGGSATSTARSRHQR
jgi:hypothetical protein